MRDQIWKSRGKENAWPLVLHPPFPASRDSKTLGKENWRTHLKSGGGANTPTGIEPEGREVVRPEPCFAAKPKTVSRGGPGDPFISPQPQLSASLRNMALAGDTDARPNPSTVWPIPATVFRTPGPLRQHPWSTICRTTSELYPLTHPQVSMSDSGTSRDMQNLAMRQSTDQPKSQTEVGLVSAQGVKSGGGGDIETWCGLQEAWPCLGNSDATGVSPAPSRSEMNSQAPV